MTLTSRARRAVALALRVSRDHDDNDPLAEVIRRVRQAGGALLRPYFQALCSAVAQGAQKMVFDPFHILAHMNKALDIVRRRENRELLAGDTRRFRHANTTP